MARRFRQKRLFDGGDALLDALEYLHVDERPIIHGNINPQNLKLKSDGQIVVASFAVSNEPPETASQGDVSAFVAPERGKDARSDLYSLGATLYYLMTGATPPTAEERIEAVASGGTDPLRRLDELNSQVDAAVADALSRAMQPNRDERFASAAEMRNALRVASPSLADNVATVRMDGPASYETAPLAQPKSGARVWLIGAVAIVLIAAMAITLIVMKRGSSASGSAYESADSSPAIKTLKLSAHDMEIFFQEFLPPQAQQQIASDPERKKELIKEVKQFFAVAEKAEADGYAERPEVRSQISLHTENFLYASYKEKHADMKVSDEEINAYHKDHPTAFDDFLKANPMFEAQMQGPQGEQTREQFKKDFATLKLVADRARNEKLQQDDVTRMRLLFERGKVLREAYLKDLEKSLDDQLKQENLDQYYEAHKSDFEEVRARHILIRLQPGDNEDEKRKKAESTLARIRKGEDFAKVAKEVSEDPGSNDKGGDLDYVMKGTLVPEFEQAMLALKPGEVSDVVKTQFGFHIIKVEDRRIKPAPSTDENSRQQVIEAIKEERFQKSVEEIAAASNIEIAEDFNTTPKPFGHPAMIPPAGEPETEAK